MTSIRNRFWLLRHCDGMSLWRAVLTMALYHWFIGSDEFGRAQFAI